MNKPKILIFASGSKNGGGSGAENLILSSRDGRLNADIVGVISNHPNGGVRQRADKLGIPFILFEAPWTGERYQKIAEGMKADFFALSGWLKLVTGLNLNTRFNSKTVFNIHPGPLPFTKGLYGRKVHKRILRSYKNGIVGHTTICMQFINGKYDDGPVFFEQSVPILKKDTLDTLSKRVNHVEHRWQPILTDLVVNGKICWDGKNESSLKPY